MRPWQRRQRSPGWLVVAPPQKNFGCFVQETRLVSLGRIQLFCVVLGVVALEERGKIL